jgi:hypothetical protein
MLTRHSHSLKLKVAVGEKDFARRDAVLENLYLAMLAVSSYYVLVFTIELLMLLLKKVQASILHWLRSIHAWLCRSRNMKTSIALPLNPPASVAHTQHCRYG